MDEVDELKKLIDSTGNSLFDELLKIGLFIGALFQLACIFAVIFIPSSLTEQEESEERDRSVSNERREIEEKKAMSNTSVTGLHGSVNESEQHGKQRKYNKMEKKKKR